jgi:hypothetical protein
MPNCESIFHHSNQGYETLWPCHLTSESIKAKEELWKLKYFTTQKYIIFKKSSKTYQNPSRCYNSIANLNFPTQVKISSLRNPHIKIDITEGPKSIKLLYSMMNLNTI